MLWWWFISCVSATPLLNGFPKLIWQTYRSKQLPLVAATFQNTWRDMNPGWELRMMDDDEARQLLATHFSAAHVDAFDRFPIAPTFGATASCTDLAAYMPT